MVWLVELCSAGLELPVVVKLVELGPLPFVETDLQDLSLYFVCCPNFVLLVEEVFVVVCLTIGVQSLSPLFVPAYLFPFAVVAEVVVVDS